MTSREHKIEIFRGATFSREFMGQTRVDVYDPATHNTAADLARTHAENLAEYGYTYAYVDYATDYASAELIVTRPGRAGKPKEAILTLTSADGEIVLGARSFKIVLSDEATQAIDFDEGSYKLRLITAGGDVDIPIYGEFAVHGDR